MNEQQKEYIRRLVEAADSVEAWYKATQERPKYRVPLINSYTKVAADFVRKYTVGRFRNAVEK